MTRRFKNAFCNSAMPDNFPNWQFFCKRVDGHPGRCRQKFTDAYRTWSIDDIKSTIESFDAVKIQERKP